MPAAAQTAMNVATPFCGWRNFTENHACNRLGIALSLLRERLGIACQAIFEKRSAVQAERSPPEQKTLATKILFKSWRYLAERQRQQPKQENNNGSRR